MIATKISLTALLTVSTALWAITGALPCTVTINPKSETVLLGETIQFSASEEGICNTPCYSWEITEAGSNGSTIDAHGLYTAGSTTGMDTVKVTDPCNGDISDTATVLVSMDSDNDGIPDAVDNCPNHSNPGQANSDSDGLGNVCDNCWEVANPDQLDSNESCPALPYSNDPACGDACEAVVTDYYVATTGDDLANDGLSPSSPFATIQHALDTAFGTQENPVTIHVAAGTYYQNIVMDDFESLEGGWNSGFAQRWDFAHQGVDPPAAHETIIDGNATSHCIKLQNLTSEDLFIDGFTITNGKASTRRGSGIYCYASSLTIANCKITNNLIDAEGGSFGAGLYIYSNASATVTNCIFFGNRVIPHQDPVGSFYDYNGGGMYVNVNSSAVVTNCIFTGNSAEQGGAIHIGINSNASFTGCTFTENEAYNTYITGHWGVGGAISTISSLAITNCIFTDNLAARWGGAFADDGKSCIITNCIFTGNRSKNERKPPAWSDKGTGGAIYNNNSTSLGTITNCTFADNTAGVEGGAISNYGGAHPTLINCIVWGNTAPTDPQIHNRDASIATVTYCDIDQDGYEGSNGNIRQDPEFIGGGNYHLTENSPCIDAGDNAGVPADTADLDKDGNTGELTPLDLGYVPRFVDNPNTPDTGNGTPPIVDMGAYELVQDTDSDGIEDQLDNCPVISNGPALGTCYSWAGMQVGTTTCQSDDDCGGTPDSCSNNQEDEDTDGRGNVCDNCPSVSNPNQADTYPPQGNKIGDACDCEANFDCDQDVDANDVTTLLQYFGRSQYNNPCTNANQCKGDFVCDGDVDADDVSKLLEDFGRSQYNNPCPTCVAGNWCVYP